MRVTHYKNAQGESHYIVSDFNSWEDFEPFVMQLVQKLSGKVVEKINEVYVKIWYVDFNATIIVFSLDDWMPLGVYAKEQGWQNEKQLQKVIEFLESM